MKQQPPHEQRCGATFLLAVVALISMGCGGDGSGTPRCPDCRFEKAPICHRFVCNEDNGACEAAKLEDGAACDSLDSCSYGDRCYDGECVPGTAVECPVRLCYAATCDPASDTCAYQPTDEGFSCALPCFPEGVCVAGQCVGDETDCSWLSDSCNLGQCHAELGDCYLEPVELGTACVAADPSCASASCDGVGFCVDDPFDDGTGCDDGDRCTANDTCASGACEGAVITACTDGDGCCPTGCTGDTDCCTAVGPDTDSSAWRFEGVARYDTDAGHVVLTPARNWMWGQMWLEHEVPSPFVARFRFRGAMSPDNSADGIVFMFYKDANYTPGAGGELTFDAGDGCNDMTVGTGYGIEIDNWPNPCDSSGDHFALIHQRIGNHLAVIDDPRTADGLWHEMVVTVDVGSVAVELDGGLILSWAGVLDRSFGGFGFGAATGGANDEYVIDDIELSCL